MPNLINLSIPQTSLLPDNGQWTNRFKIHSSSSDHVYTIAQNKSGRHWGCSCKGWIFHRKCKHLTQLGLPNFSQPMEVRINAPATSIRVLLAGDHEPASNIGDELVVD